MSSTRRPARLVGTVVALVLGAAAVVVVTAAVGIRTRNSTIIRSMHRWQRDVVNPRALTAAGRPGSPHAVLRHVGRSSGRHYETPVGAFVTNDAVAIALVYGTRVDWVRNILASGHASIVVNGSTFELADPAVVPLSESPLAGSMDLTARIFGITDALVMRRTPS